MTSTNVTTTTSSPIADVHAVYHPLFSEVGDLILRSKDNTFFRMSRETLSRTSPWFRTMLKLPPSDGSDFATPISMDESADVLAALLAMISGIELPNPNNFDHLESLLRAADKYEMPMAISALRSVLFSPLTDAPSPIRLYGIACRMSWEEEAKLAASRTVGMDLLAPAALDELVLLDAPHRDKLVALHRQRKDQLVKLLDDVNVFYANDQPGRCTRDECTARPEHGAWYAFKYALLKRLEHSPVGDTLDQGVYRMDQLEGVRSARCPECSIGLYNISSTIANLQDVVKALPKTVEWP